MKHKTGKTVGVYERPERRGGRYIALGAVVVTAITIAIAVVILM